LSAPSKVVGEVTRAILDGGHLEFGQFSKKLKKCNIIRKIKCDPSKYRFLRPGNPFLGLFLLSDP
jgi:hypothetical protein